MTGFDERKGLNSIRTMPISGKLEHWATQLGLMNWNFFSPKQASHNETINGSNNTQYVYHKKLKSEDYLRVQIFHGSKLEHCVRSGALKYLTCFKEFISTAFQFESRLDFHYIWCSECRRSIQSIFSGPWKYFTINIPLNKEFSSRMPKV